jgi:hypothetical protein
MTGKGAAVNETAAFHLQPVEMFADRPPEDLCDEPSGPTPRASLDPPCFNPVAMIEIVRRRRPPGEASGLALQGRPPALQLQSGMW